MGANIHTPQLEVATPSIEVEVLSPEEKGRVTAELMWDETPAAELPEVAKRVEESVLDPTERNFVIAGLLSISREKMEATIEATEFDDADVIAAMNDVLDERDSDIGLIGGGEPELEIAAEEVA